MSKRKILVKEAGLMNFFKSFFNAKANNKESEWLAKLRKADPNLADVWSDYDKSLTKSMIQQRDMLKRRGLDSSGVDTIIKKYGLKVD
jgi:hypothetical protein